MFKIDKTPIIIISSPRTGSTILADHISNTNNLICFSEPDSGIFETRHTLFMKYVHEYHEYNFVLKFHALNFSPYYENLEIFKNSHNIFLYRKNIIEQIASYHIALIRNCWHYQKNHNYDFLKNSIAIDKQEIINTINKILKANKAVDNIDLHMHQKVYYEDLDMKLFDKTSPKIKTPKPSNYDEVIAEIKIQLEKMNIQV